VTFTPLSMLGGYSGTPPGLPSIDNGAHGTEKLNTQVSEDFA
jgi:hypothetical protein